MSSNSIPPTPALEPEATDICIASPRDSPSLSSMSTIVVSTNWIPKSRHCTIPSTISRVKSFKPRQHLPSVVPWMATTTFSATSSI
ncbi:hypothetical protein E1B28_002526 [Marasmius oreades]|uniref:Uncharacterized protein n=1 Tax=Marasmius oreades TaxID=181124 RepID=A0A9P7RN73_9AGAR|nr:uncharacterized protein E1B28_002526 [Marasmius oreades]KAG7086580.1 hypothetical protein E1B28_002526 [Marasmius oreades]